MSTVIKPTSPDHYIVKEVEDTNLYDFNLLTRRPTSDFATNTLTKATGSSLKNGFVTMFFNTTLSLSSSLCKDSLNDIYNLSDFMDESLLTIKAGTYLAIISFENRSTTEISSGVHKSSHVLPWNQGGNLPDSTSYYTIATSFPNEIKYVVAEKRFNYDTVMSWDSNSGRQQIRQITLFKKQDNQPETEVSTFNKYKCDFRSVGDRSKGMFLSLKTDGAASTQSYTSDNISEALYSLWWDNYTINDFYIGDHLGGNVAGTRPLVDGFNDGFYGKWIKLSDSLRYKNTSLNSYRSGVKEYSLSFRGSSEIGGIGNGADFTIDYYDPSSTFPESYSFTYWVRVDDYNKFSSVNVDRTDDGILKYLYQPDTRSGSKGLYEDTFNIEFNSSAASLQTAVISIFGAGYLSSYINPTNNNISDLFSLTGKIPKVAYVTLENADDLNPNNSLRVYLGSETQSQDYLKALPIGPFLNNTVLGVFDYSAEDDGIVTYGSSVKITSTLGLANIKLKLHVLEWI